MKCPLIDSASNAGEQVSFFQIGKGLPKVFLAVGFKSDKRMEIMVTQKLKKTGKVKFTPSRRQMLI